MHYVGMVRPLMAAALALSVASCGETSGDRAANEQGAVGAVRPSAASVRTGFTAVAGGRIFYQVFGDLGSQRTPLLVLPGAM